MNHSDATLQTAAAEGRRAGLEGKTRAECQYAAGNPAADAHLCDAWITGWWQGRGMRADQADMFNTQASLI